MDKFVNKDGVTVMVITDTNEVTINEKHFKDVKESECNHDEECPACSDKKEDESI
ncbi:MAG: hypothetical protein PHY47_01285 [Lachnospiraceae bacterium]|nr:hypothetical protein [Lachnospiraceae bacterium]